MVAEEVKTNYCQCKHKQSTHELYTDKCDNCDCSEFTLSRPVTEAMTRLSKPVEDLRGSMCVTPSEHTPSQDLDIQGAGSKHRGPTIVGIESHPFQSDESPDRTTSDLCVGILGYAPTDPKYGMTCYNPRNAPIHQTIPDSGLKDSGKRLQFDSGMVRDVDDTKPAFDLVIPEGIPYEELMLTRWADLLRKGAIKYSRRNWEKADSNEELDRAKASAFRHFMQWFSGESDEDHAAAVFFNINEVETIRYKQKKENA